MSKKCPTCSQPSTERSNLQGEARCGEPASRNVIELDSASLHKVGAANLPDRTKPAIAGEAALECSLRSPRGNGRQCAGKEKSRNLGMGEQRTKWLIIRDRGPRTLHRLTKIGVGLSEKIGAIRFEQFEALPQMQDGPPARRVDQSSLSSIAVWSIPGPRQDRAPQNWHHALANHSFWAELSGCLLTESPCPGPLCHIRDCQ